jgi:transcriptional regulator
MYLPPQFKARQAAHAAELIRAYPLASLISNDDGGFPFVTHLPLHLLADQEPWRLLGHVAKANPHWRYLQARPEALVTFMGPHAYMTPRVYPDLVRVPTWNYLAVHCKVAVKLIEDPLAKDRLLKKLIGDHDPSYAPQWIALGQDYQHKMLAGIVAFELTLIDLQCKLKLNQHRPEAHAQMRALYAAGRENEQALAQWMDRLGMHGDMPQDASAASTGASAAGAPPAPHAKS